MIVERRNRIRSAQAFIMQLFRLFAIRFSQLRRGIESLARRHDHRALGRHA